MSGFTKIQAVRPGPLQVNVAYTPTDGAQAGITLLMLDAQGRIAETRQYSLEEDEALRDLLAQVGQHLYTKAGESDPN